MGDSQDETQKAKIKKAQQKWRNMRTENHEERALPGSKGGGAYYRIIMKPKEMFTDFRYQDVGRPGGLQRLAGKRKDGRWSTQAWLISKDQAHIAGKRLIPDSDVAKDLLKQLGIKPVRQKGDVFLAQGMLFE